jgi:hypothetical protein
MTVQLTRSIDEFISLLQPADVLLFDSLRPASHIIKLAENRPVNHAALYQGDAKFVHATKHEPGYPAVQPGSLDSRLETGSDRTVTALRHLWVLDGRLRADAVLSQAEQMAEAGGSYDWVDLLSLALPTFWRSYHHHIDRHGLAGSAVSRMLDYLSKSVLAAIESDPNTRQMVTSIASDAMTVTCSEMVYRCYDLAANYSIEVSLPLSAWASRPSTSIRGLAEESMAEQATALDFYPPLPEGSMGDRTSGLILRGGYAKDPPSLRSGTGPTLADLRDMLTRARVALNIQAHRNLALRKYGERPPLPKTVLADCVTPRDLWSSPSFAARIIFHRPASELDDWLDARID